MYCTSCGAENLTSSRFCGQCGRTVDPGGIPLSAPTESRLAGHIRLLGILWIASSAIHLIPGLFLVLLFSAGTAMLPWLLPSDLLPLVIAWVPILVCIGAFILACSIAGIAAGWGLLERKPWARTLSILLGIFSLPDLPFGTALGVYTLWVLLPAESEQQYDAEARAQYGARWPIRA